MASLADFGGLHHRAFDDPMIATLMKRLWQETENSGGAVSQLFADGALLAITAMLLQLEHGHVRPPPSQGGLTPLALRHVRECIEAGLADNLGLAQLAEAAGLSPWHFARCFKVDTGLTPATYVMQRRVERAQEMLAAADTSVTDIAYACGFASSQHMATVLRRMVGATPTECRKERRS